jgi:hypothetical protein
VRALEAEVRELKDLLDEKDEKIDMLSRVRSQSTSFGKKKNGGKSVSPATIVESTEASPSEGAESFKIVQSSNPAGSSSGSLFFSGSSSARSLSSRSHL